MFFLDSCVPLSWEPEENAPDLSRMALRHDSLLTDSPGLVPYYSNTVSYLGPLGQGGFDPAGTPVHYSTFPASSSSLDSDDSEGIYTPTGLTQDQTTWISSGPEYGLGPALAQHLPSDEVISYMSSFLDSLQIPYTTSPKPQAALLSEDIEETITGYSATFVDAEPTDWAIGPPEVALSHEVPSTFSFADPPSKIDNSQIPVENTVQKIVPKVVWTPPYTSTLMLKDLVWSCGWKNEDGILCADVVTYAGLPGHLAKHGIIKLSRGSPTKCNWLGCKKKEPMNRESIVRHIREVHMGVKRPTKRVIPSPSKTI